MSASLLDRLTSLDSSPAALQTGLELVIAHFGADSGTLHLLRDGELHLTAHSAGLPPQVLQVIRVIPIGKGMAGLAAERRAPVTACNLQTDTTGDVRPGARATGLKGSIVVPMERPDGLVGTLGIANHAERDFTPEEVELLLAAGRALAKG
jgi:L-methionine (R)-S-oxide reductase